MAIKALTLDIWATVLDDRRLRRDRHAYRCSVIKNHHKTAALEEIQRAFSSESCVFSERWKRTELVSLRHRTRTVLELLGISNEEQLDDLSFQIAMAIVRYPPDVVEGAYAFLKSASEKYRLVQFAMSDFIRAPWLEPFSSRRAFYRSSRTSRSPMRSE